MFPESVIRKLPILGESPEISPNIVHVRSVPAREARWLPLPAGLDPRLRTALAHRGIDRVYSHQRRAFDLARAGKDFVVVTPTASGKTLCYNLPVTQTLLEDEAARALYIFPTKALSQDQQAELNEVALGGNLPLGIFTYDGDTPASLRTAARSRGRIIITNPDMLHAGVLPNHARWIQFFSGLRYIVVDEAHSCRGVYGSHVANVLRRVLRVAAFYGARPSFIFCSATVGNPRELAAELAGRPVELVDENGARAGEKLIALYNPPLLDPVQGIRKSTSTESVNIALALLRGGVKTILFARSRVQVELIARYINDALANIYTDNAGIVVKPYRSGLLPSERRAIERGLRDGSIRGVVSTNALELGIDIGGLDASVMAGFPGSMASFWQQLGRAGRSGSLSLGVFVASSSPLDQYLVSHPEYFFRSSPEEARIDPDNPYIFMDHIKCAAFELPFKNGEGFGIRTPNAGQAQPDGNHHEGALGSPGGFVDETAMALSSLAQEGTLRQTSGRWYWSAEGYPAEKISLRSATADTVVIIDVTAGKHHVIGEMDRASAKELIYDNAVYIHLGRQYLVRRLDIANRVCEVEARTVEYWTDAVVKTDIHVLTEDEELEGSGRYRAVLGDVLVRNQAEKFKKLRFHTHENIGYGDIDLPAEEMQTRALMLIASEGSESEHILSDIDQAFSAAVLAGAARLIHTLAPVFLLCDQRDLGRAERIRDPHFGRPALYFYDRYPGGTGLAEGMARHLPRILEAACARLATCPCQAGCPSCIGVDFSMSNGPAAPGTSAAVRNRGRSSVLKLLSAWGGPGGDTQG